MNPTCILGILFFFSLFIRSWKHKRRNRHTDLHLLKEHSAAGSRKMNPWVSWGRDTRLPASSPLQASCAPQPHHVQKGPDPICLVRPGWLPPHCPWNQSLTFSWPPDFSWIWIRVHCWCRINQRCIWRTHRLWIVHWCGIKELQLCGRSYWVHSWLQFNSQRKLFCEEYVAVTAARIQEHQTSTSMGSNKLQPLFKMK